MTRIIDVSLPVSADLAIWPGNPAFELRAVKRISQGGSSNLSEIRSGTHMGTHVDAPHHFIDGAATTEEAPLDAFVGPAVVADLTHVDETIGTADLDALDLPGGTERLLLKTRNSEAWARDPTTFPERFVWLSRDGAAWCVARGIRLVGTDFLGIEAREGGGETHRALLGAGVWIVEGLDLSAVEPGTYRFVCLPQRLVGADGAPARAILIAG